MRQHFERNNKKQGRGLFQQKKGHPLRQPFTIRVTYECYCTLTLLVLIRPVSVLKRTI